MSKGVFLTLALTALLVLGAIFLFLLNGALGVYNAIGFKDFLLSKDYYPDSELFGIFSMIINTLLSSFLALVISGAFGVFVAIYICFFAKNKVKKALILLIQILSMIPSVLYGFFALCVIVPFISSVFDVNGKGFLSAVLLLSIMIMPTIILLSYTFLNSVNKDYLKASLALGLSLERSSIVVLKACSSGVITAFILAYARGIGEAMAVVMVAGNQPQLISNIFDGFRSLSANIVLEMGYAQDLHKEVLIASGFVLFMIVFLINAILVRIKNA